MKRSIVESAPFANLGFTLFENFSSKPVVILTVLGCCNNNDQPISRILFVAYEIWLFFRIEGYQWRASHSLAEPLCQR